MKSTWPSLAIGCLKGYLAANGISSRCCHLHLEAAAKFGWVHYDALENTWGAGEALFGSLLDPADSHRLVSVAAQLLRDANHPATATWAERTARHDLRAFVDAWLERERPQDYLVVGGSIGAMQLCASLYLMKRLRERGHKGWRIFGGSGLVGSVAGEVLQRCSDIDAVVEGEGEQALLAIAKRITSELPSSFEGLPQVLTRNADGNPICGDAVSSLDLSSAPPANLDEYFETAQRLGIPKTGLTIPFEHSRGCAWEHRTKGKLRGCTFCGLYRNSPDYRRKSVERILRDVEDAVNRYRVLNLGFVDAYLPGEYRDDLLDGLIRLPSDVSFFTELRCDLTKATVERLAARASRVQLGVESFTTAILRRIGKGIGAAASVHSVRLCQEYGIPTQYNLMLRIPGVPRSEIDALNEVLPILFGLIPPNATNFYLDRNSLIFADPEAHGVAPDSLDVDRPDWLPHSLGDSRISQVVPFTFIGTDAEDAWSRIESQVERWHERWRSAKSASVESPLSWRDGGGWASIVDMRGDVAKIYHLEGILYDVFMACGKIVSEAKLAQLLPHHSLTLLSDALRELVSHRLILRDGPFFISVAVRAGSRMAGWSARR
jgi:ribosomal peptide maturation radical SAM protein 1